MLETIRYYLQKKNMDSLVTQSLFTLLLRIFGVIVLFGFTFFLTHNFSPHVIGQYDFVRSYLFVIGSICLLGCDQSILYFKGRLSGTNSLDGFKNTYFKMMVLVLLSSLLLFLLFKIIDKAWITTFFDDTGVYPILLKSTAILFLYAVTVLNTEVFRALDHLYLAELFRNTIKYLPVILGSIFLLKYGKETYLAEIFLYGFILLAIITTLFIMYFFHKMEGTANSTSFSYKEITLKSYPIAVSGMALFLLMSFDILFLKIYHDDATVAFYSIAVKIMTLLTMISLTVNITVSAKIAEYFATKNDIEMHSIIKKSVRLIVVITAPVTLIMCLLSNQLLGFFGENYKVATTALLILIVGQGICSIFGTATVYLNMTGRQATFQRTLLVAVLINFILNRFLIPKYGMIGAAIAFVSSTFFWNLCATIIIYKKDKVKVYLN
ncbi:MATE family efflux transporter [Flavobacterium sp. W21_SRS_FM3]